MLHQTKPNPWDLFEDHEAQGGWSKNPYNPVNLMAKVRRKVLTVLYSIKLRLSMLKLWVGKKFGLIRSVMIMPYQGFGNRNEQPTPPVVYSNIFVPSEKVEFGVISNIDDTIVPTGATRLWEILKTTFMGNAT